MQRRARARGGRRTRAARRLAARLAGLAALALLAACAPPRDAGRSRPEAVRATRFEQRELRVLGLRLRYVDEGPSAGPRDLRRPAVLVIPGHTARIEGFDEMIPALARRHRVLVLDLPGSGYSEKPERDYTLRFYEDVLVAFLDSVGAPQAHLVGGSLGGNLVLRLGHRFPDRFPRLVAWAPAGAWEAHPWVAAGMRGLGGFALFWPTVWVQSRYWYADDWPGRDAALAETFAYYDEVMGPGFLRMYWGIAADQVAQSLFTIAPEIAQPTLLCWGDLDDGANMGEGVARLHRLLPHSKLRVFPGARHSLESEIPGPLGEAVDEFLRRPATLLP